MHRSKRLPLAAATVAGCSLAFVAAAGAFPSLPGVSSGQPKAVGVPAPTVLSPGPAQVDITRINLDADPAHRVTLMATQESNGTPLVDIDGSTWDPFAHKLLFTTENSGAGEYQATLGWPSQVQDISGYIGRGGYEGIQNDS